jgi:NAD(P)H-dependent FMN reductase
VNALNYVYGEWTYKPCAFVSYGGVSGGLRAVQLTKQIVTTLKMMPIMEAVTVPMVGQSIKDGVFAANDLHRKSAADLLTELGKWAGALKPLRG